jgi:hypothetical protein
MPLALLLLTSALLLVCAFSTQHQHTKTNECKDVEKYQNSSIVDNREFIIEDYLQREYIRR